MLTSAEAKLPESEKRPGSGPPPLPPGHGRSPEDPLAFEPPRPQVSPAEVPPPLEEEESPPWLDLSTVSSSLVSAVVHMLLMLSLAVYALEPEIRDDYSLIAALTEDTGAEPEPEQISFQLPPEPKVKAALPQAVPREDVFGRDLGGPDSSYGAISSDLVGKLNAGAFGVGGQEQGVKGDGKGTRFFGIDAAGKKFVYVVDASTSMKGERFGKAARELHRSINSMNDEQHFYVIFFSDRDYPLFAPRPAVGMVPASRRNKIRFQRWVRHIELVPETNARPAMIKALELEPDAIFLLTDGEFSDDTEDILMGWSSYDVPIHTICFESTEGEPALMRIAERYHGTYRFVP